MSNKVRSAVVNKPVGVEFNVIKVVCILFFHIWLVLEPKSNQSQSIPKIFRNIDYKQTFCLPLETY